MYVCCGLGNPGNKYHSNRHNIGFKVIDELIKLHECPPFDSDCKGKVESTKCQIFPIVQRQVVVHTHGTVPFETLMLKPQLFMNKSGLALKSAIQFYSKQILPLSVESGQQLMVVHDDLDLSVGEWKIQFGKGPKIHNGLISVYKELGSKSFWHVRVGVDGRKGDRSIPGSAYVLQDFTKPELQLIDLMIKDELLTAITQQIGGMIGGKIPINEMISI